MGGGQERGEGGGKKNGALPPAWGVRGSKRVVRAVGGCWDRERGEGASH